MGRGIPFESKVDMGITTASSSSQGFHTYYHKLCVEGFIQVSFYIIGC